MNIRKLTYAFVNYSYNNIITHIPVRILRLSFLRLFNRNIHATAVILMHTRILNFWRIQIGEGAVINQYCVLDCRVNKIFIGAFTDIGPYTHIWSLGHDPDSETHNVLGGDVTIGHHVWIASRVTVLPSVNLADGTVVAACSVVHKSTEENDVIAGNPARVTRKRKNTLQYRMKFNPFFE
jgi:putative colanic acid biosynthesis acetyltransferase WcaF